MLNNINVYYIEIMKVTKDILMNFIKKFALCLTTLFFMSGCAQVAKQVAPDVAVEGVSFNNNIFSPAAVVNLKLTNKNAFTLPLTDMTYDFYLYDTLLAQGTLPEAQSIPAKESRNYNLNVALNLANFTTLLKNIKSGSNAKYKLVTTISLGNYLQPIVVVKEDEIPFSF